MIETLICLGIIAVCGSIWNYFVSDVKKDKGHVPIGNIIIAIIGCLVALLIAFAIAAPFLPSDEEAARQDYYYEPGSF